MKKRLFKGVGLVMALVLSVGMLAGCGSKEKNAETPAAEEEAVAEGEVGTGFSYVEEDSQYPSAEELKEKGYKFGFAYWSFTDTLGKQFKAAAEYFCEQFGIEPVFVEYGLETENTITAAQNLIEMGCDAITGGFEYAEIAKLCEENGVVQMFYCNNIQDETLLNYVKDMEYFGGMVTEDDYATAYNSVVAMYEAGCRNIGFLGITPGNNTLHDDRARGIKDALADYPEMTLVADYYGLEGFGETVSQWLTLYPEMDGIIQSWNEGTAIAAIYSEGAEDRVKIGVFDVADGTIEAIQDGVCVWCATGQANTLTIACLLAYNQLMGDDLIEDNTVVYKRPFLQITGVESYNDYVKYCEGDVPPYTGEELKSYIKAWNPDVTIDDIVAMNEAWSIEDVVARHQDIVD